MQYNKTEKWKYLQDTYHTKIDYKPILKVSDFTFLINALFQCTVYMDSVSK